MQGRWRGVVGVSVFALACGGGDVTGSTAGSGAGTSAAGRVAAVSGGAGAPGNVAPAQAGAAGRATGASGASATAGTAAAAGGGAASSERFSFFVTSLDAMRELSGSTDGFGGDLRYGQSDGLSGADKICSDIAERSLPGASSKGWHAFLSAKTAGPGGAAVHARDRIGTGPWYDRTGRLVATDLAALLATRPKADAAIIDDLPNETGAPNRGSANVDNHDVVTGSDAQGRYADGGVTCEDWTSVDTATTSSGSSGGRPGAGHNGPMCGHSWPAQSGRSWIAAHAAPGCAPSVSLAQNGGGSGTGIGNGGGYGAIYCFAMLP